ncbi:uncharacterized protein LOC124928688 [Impatiens glandulifera]|uniref:uncharacterized protein LOC124928688 n=1 Tax=Impatiens glandulifera TaxID=253017 RepID=UPI001FB19A3E|nr:uncharacterized protein LOC124928688 [Impatiens glandulifera]
MSEKSFEDTVKHAQKCSFNRETYWHDGVVFNIIGEIIGLDHFDGQFIAFDQLLDDNKAIARKSVLFAFNSKENLLVPYKEASSHRLIPTPIHHEDNHHHPLNEGMNEFYEKETEVDLSGFFVDDWNHFLSNEISMMNVNAGSNGNNTCYSTVVRNSHKRWKLLYGVSRLIFKRRNVSEFLYEAHKRQKMMIIC